VLWGRSVRSAPDADTQTYYTVLEQSVAMGVGPLAKEKGRIKMRMRNVRRREGESEIR